MSRRVVRLGVSLEPDLLAALDEWVKERDCPSRSEALRFLVRKELVEKTLSDPDADAVGTILVLYKHTAPNVMRRLISAEHRWGEHIQSSTHVHLEDDVCMEALILKGRRREVERAGEDLRGVKGISHCVYLVSTPGVAGGRSGHRHPHRHDSSMTQRT